MLRCLHYFLLAWLIPLTALAAPPSHIEAVYRVSLEGLDVAEMTETFTRKDGRYRIESVSRSVGLAALFKPETMRIVSEGRVTDAGLRPDHVRQTRERQSQRNSHADFDWERHTLTLNDLAGQRSVTLPDDTQDRISAMYQFLFLTLDGKDTLDFHMTNGSKLDDYSYRLSDPRPVKVPFGTFSARYVTTPPQANGGQTEIWLAAEQYHLPVKMVVTEGNGNRYVQVLTALTVTP